MDRLAPRLLVKVGADGVYTASATEHGLGIALKIDDGSDVAARVALGAVLGALGLIDDDDRRALGEYLAPEIANSPRRGGRAQRTLLGVAHDRDGTAPTGRRARTRAVNEREG